MLKALAAALSFALGLVGATASPRAQSVEQFYKGRTLTLLVATSPGGRYDLNARLIARHLGQFLPGHPNVVVQNEPGAGGLMLANRLANTIQNDGSIIALMQPATPLVAFQGDPNAKFDPLKLTWLGSLSTSANDADLLIVNTRFAAKSASDLKKPGLVAKIGADMPGATNLIFGTIARDVLRLNIDLVRGYPGAPALFVAMQNGELDGQVVLYSSIMAAQHALWAKGLLRPLVQFGRLTRLPALPDVPTARELVSDPESIALLDFAELPFFMALPLVGPPGLPADRARALEQAFMKMTQDPAFVADLRRARLELSPEDSARVRQLLEQASRAPKSVIARYNAIVKPSD
jgi:tripartite-type tricarboxylate transporter receptor subunit TctC